MYPPIRERLGVVADPYPAVEGRLDAGPMARSMMYLFAAGAAVASVSLLVAPAGTPLPRIAAIGSCALALAGFVLVAYDRIPIWGFQDLFATELERARRTGRPLSVIICDLDSFKAVNDRFGHAAGDRALEQLSGILRRAKRRIDTAARVGGEEFAVIAPDSDQHAAYILAERMRREVRERFAAEPYTLTLSLGLATFPRHGAYAEALIGGADEALYAAKKLGRDRTVVFNPEIAETLLAATGRPSARFERQGPTVAALAEGC